MYFYTWMTICFAVLFHLVNSRSLRHARSPNQCTGYYLDVLHEIAQKTRVAGCGASRGKRAAVIVDDVDLDEVLRLYGLLTHVNEYTGLASSPVETYGLLNTGNNEVVPVYIIADIRIGHLPGPNTRVSFRNDVAQRMMLMGQQGTDERGHLLAHSLGGSSDANNIVPMAQNLNRHLEYRSYWRSNEDWIRTFLGHYPNGRVSWRLAVQYDDHVYTNPNPYNSLRPVNFILQYTAYTDQNDDDSVYHRTPVITYLNDNDYFCGYRVRRRRSIEANVNCEVKHRKQLQGVVGPEMLHGGWKQRYEVSFPFTVRGKHYFYGQSIRDGHNWFIQELLPNGQMGQETDHGFWSYYYQTAFSFFINGRTFFYGSSTSTYNWFIQELLPGGKMGGETDHGDWKQRYQVAFYYTIEGRHFFYAQSIVDGHNWFIQELLPGGKMGNEISHGFLSEYYHVAFPYRINGRQFFYAQSHDSKNWFIRELMADGTMGSELSSGKWKERYKVNFPFQFGGKHYFYGQSILDGGNWFIQELLPDGRMGVETGHGFLDGNYHVSFPYKIDGRQYFYGHSTDTFNYCIHEIV